MELPRFSSLENSGSLRMELGAIIIAFRSYIALLSLLLLTALW